MAYTNSIPGFEDLKVPKIKSRNEFANSSMTEGVKSDMFDLQRNTLGEKSLNDSDTKKPDFSFRRNSRENQSQRPKSSKGHRGLFSSGSSQPINSQLAMKYKSHKSEERIVKTS